MKETLGRIGNDLAQIRWRVARMPTARAVMFGFWVFVAIAVFSAATIAALA